VLGGADPGSAAFARCKGEPFLMIKRLGRNRLGRMGIQLCGAFEDSRGSEVGRAQGPGGPSDKCQLPVPSPHLAEDPQKGPETFVPLRSLVKAPPRILTPSCS
jgi:hypothetical protein